MIEFVEHPNGETTTIHDKFDVYATESREPILVCRACGTVGTLCPSQVGRDIYMTTAVCKNCGALEGDRMIANLTRNVMTMQMMGREFIMVMGGSA